MGYYVIKVGSELDPVVNQASQSYEWTQLIGESTSKATFASYFTLPSMRNRTIHIPKSNAEGDDAVMSPAFFLEHTEGIARQLEQLRHVVDEFYVAELDLAAVIIPKFWSPRGVADFIPGFIYGICNPIAVLFTLTLKKAGDFFAAPASWAKHIVKYLRKSPPGPDASDFDPDLDGKELTFGKGFKLFCATVSPILWLLAQPFYFFSNGINYFAQIVDGASCLLTSGISLLTRLCGDTQKYTPVSVSLEAIVKNTFLFLPMAFVVAAFCLPVFSTICWTVIAHSFSGSIPSIFLLTTAAAVGQLLTAGISYVVDTIKQCGPRTQSLADKDQQSPVSPGDKATPRSSHATIPFKPGAAGVALSAEQPSVSPAPTTASLPLPHSGAAPSSDGPVFARPR